MKRALGIAGIALIMGLSATPGRADEPAHALRGGWRWIVSPLAGVDRNEMTVRTPMGGTRTETDWGPQYGLYLMAMHPNWVFSNFLFFADVNDSDVWGNLTFLNYYHDATARVTWNVGAGYLIHGIDTPQADITVDVPMIKGGPVFRIPDLRLTLNPYIGHAWERTDVDVAGRSSTHRNDGILYGLTAGWRWRMLHVGMNYYYQDNQDRSGGEHTFRLRSTAMVNRRWGVHARVDYMEHSTTDDLSFMAGPVFAF